MTFQEFEHLPALIGRQIAVSIAELAFLSLFRPLAETVPAQFLQFEFNLTVYYPQVEPPLDISHRTTDARTLGCDWGMAQPGGTPGAYCTIDSGECESKREPRLWRSGRLAESLFLRYALE